MPRPVDHSHASLPEDGQNLVAGKARQVLPRGRIVGSGRFLPAVARLGLFGRNGFTQGRQDLVGGGVELLQRRLTPGTAFQMIRQIVQLQSDFAHTLHHSRNHRCQDLYSGRRISPCERMRGRS